MVTKAFTRREDITGRIRIASAGPIPPIITYFVRKSAEFFKFIISIPTKAAITLEEKVRRYIPSTLTPPEKNRDSIVPVVTATPAARGTPKPFPFMKVANLLYTTVRNPAATTTVDRGIEKRVIV